MTPSGVRLAQKAPLYGEVEGSLGLTVTTFTAKRSLPAGAMFAKYSGKNKMHCLLAESCFLGSFSQ